MPSMKFLSASIDMSYRALTERIKAAQECHKQYLVTKTLDNPVAKKKRETKLPEEVQSKVLDFIRAHRCVRQSPIVDDVLTLKDSDGTI